MSEITDLKVSFNIAFARNEFQADSLDDKFEIYLIGDDEELETKDASEQLTSNVAILAGEFTKAAEEEAARSPHWWLRPGTHAAAERGAGWSWQRRAPCCAVAGLRSL